MILLIQLTGDLTGKDIDNSDNGAIMGYHKILYIGNYIDVYYK